MNTTAFGLISAIPLLVLHSLLQNKTKKIVTGIEMAAVKFLNIMTIHRLIEAGAPRATGAFSQQANVSKTDGGKADSDFSDFPAEAQTAPAGA